MSNATDLLSNLLNVTPQYIADLLNEDTVGGRDTGQWIGMSVHDIEGRILYALVRHFKPRHVLEIGMAQGCGTTHILRALEKNGVGKLTSIDIDPQAGSGIPDELRHLHTFIVGDSRSAEFPKNEVDFVFEDGDHSYSVTLETLNRVLKEIAPRVLVSHDLLSHITYGDEFGVFKVWMELFGNEFALFNDAFTGLGVKVF
jgi:predicted O-methyltransferase YrrM